MSSQNNSKPATRYMKTYREKHPFSQKRYVYALTIDGKKYIFKQKCDVMKLIDRVKTEEFEATENGYVKCF